MKNTFSSLEILESRIAPATITGNVLHYTDVDGDHVTVTFSKGPMASGDFLFNTAFNNNGPQQLQLIDIHGQSGLAGMNITVKAGKSGGDGLAAIGFINATGVNLGKVTIAGDLTGIKAGTDDAVVPAIAALTVRSMGDFGLTTQAGGGLFTSTVTGKLPVLKVAKNMVDVTFTVGGANGYLGSVVVGGSLIGGDSTTSGTIASGDVSHPDNIGSVTIGKDLVGGTTGTSGAIAAFGSITKVKIGGNIIGGGGSNSGSIFAFGSIGSVTVAGSLFGGQATGSGSIIGQASLGDIIVKGNFTGGSNSGVGSRSQLGIIGSVGHVNSVTIGGSIVAGFNLGGGSLSQSPTITSTSADIGSIVVNGSIFGNSSNPVIFSGKGQAVKPALGLDTAIGSVTIKGSAVHTNILAGFDGSQADADGDASLGKIVIGGDWRAGNIVAGAHQNSAPNWGGGDTVQATNDPNLISHIASIVIGGTLEGSANPSSNFGFVAQQVDALKIGGKTFTLNVGHSNDNFQLGLNSDANVQLEEI